MREQAEDGDSGLGADVHFAVHDERSDELISISKGVAAVGGLIAVVELVGKVGGVVCVQDRRVGQG